MVLRRGGAGGAGGVVGAAFAALLVLVGALVVPFGTASAEEVGTGPPTSAPAAAAPAPSLAALEQAPRAALPDPAASLAVPGSAPATGPVPSHPSILLTLAIQNASRLSAFLSELGDPSSPQYHHYLSAAEFTDEFAPNASAYDGLTAYLASEGVGPLTTYPNRLAVSFQAGPSALSALFGTSLEPLRADGATYWAASTAPTLPAPLASEVSAISGLGATGLPLARPLASVTPAAAPPPTAPGSGSLLGPVTNGSVQYLYPADLQVAYDEESLFAEYGYPGTADVAALLWEGVYDGSSNLVACGSPLDPGFPVGPFVPGDLAGFFANTTPTGEPDASVVGVAIDGSTAAGCQASWDTSGVVASNTAELEALGETAPGATIYAVSAPGPSVDLLEGAFEAALSPPNGLSASVRAGLANVSVIATGWATTDTGDEPWVEDLAEAGARGITVVSAVGDSGDNNHSSLWDGTTAQFPATAGENSAGALAVGGLTVTLNATTDQLASEVVWNVSSTDAADGGPRGTAGGVSTEYVEPGYQLNSSANAVLKSKGRGVPDVAAVANNTLVTLSVNGTRYLATNATLGGPYLSGSGTAVAAGVVAGLIAEIDHVLEAANNSPLGFVAPTVYTLAQEALTPPVSGNGVVSEPTGPYDSELPTAPFRDVVQGANALYAASVGYDLASGWGSLDAYNFTMYVLTVPTTGVYGDLIGVRDRVHLAGLEVTSRLPPASVDRFLNASLQQDFFLANSLGAPVYEVQSEIYLVSELGGLWQMNFTANLTYPFAALYPTLSVHEGWAESSKADVMLPTTFAVTTTYEAGSGTAPPQILFAFGVPTSPTFTLTVPGAAYIIGRTGYTYSWQGATYTSGPKNGGSEPGFLTPQFVLVGAPPDWVGTFGSATAGNVTASVEAAGTTVFTPAQTGIVTSANGETAESATNLLFVASGGSLYDFYYSQGSGDAGVFQAQAPYYPLEFNESGVPDGATWYVNLSSGADLSETGGSPEVMASLQNGTYSWTAAVGLTNWSATPSSGEVTIDGHAVRISLTFGPSFATVTFKAKGPEKNGSLAFVWYANISGAPSHASSALSYETNLTFGSYSYAVASSNATFVPTKANGMFVAGPVPLVITVTFVVRTYEVEFVFHLPKGAPRFTITLGTVSDRGVFSTWGVDEAKGSYSWSIGGLPFGWAAIPSRGSIDVNGPVTPVGVTISTSGWGPFGLGVVGYVLLLVLVGLAAVWAVVYLWRRRRRRRAREAAGEIAVPPSAGGWRARRRARRARRSQDEEEDEETTDEPPEPDEGEPDT